MYVSHSISFDQIKAGQSYYVLSSGRSEQTEDVLVCTSVETKEVTVGGELVPLKKVCWSNGLRFSASSMFKNTFSLVDVPEGWSDDHLGTCFSVHEVLGSAENAWMETDKF